MNTQDKRFLHGALYEGRWVEFPHVERLPDGAGLGGDSSSWHLREWPFGPHAGARTLVMRSEPTYRPSSAMVLTATWGGGLPGFELSVGLDLHLPEADPAKVYGHADRLIGQLPAPETAQATRDTVQIDIAETLPAGTQTFGLVKVRGKVVWQDGPRHILRFHREMPIGWPAGDHHERDESALTGRTDPVRSGSMLHFGIPLLTASRTHVLRVDVGKLDETLAWMRRQANA